MGRIFHRICKEEVGISKSQKKDIVGGKGGHLEAKEKGSLTELWR